MGAGLMSLTGSLCLAESPNSALQRTGTHKVRGRGRPSHGGLRERWRARVLMRSRPAAELGS
jgi:hypothetical protein